MTRTLRRSSRRSITLGRSSEIDAQDGGVGRGGSLPTKLELAEEFGERDLEGRRYFV